MEEQQQKKQRMMGAVQKVIGPAGYGFIKADSGEAVFFHLKNLRGYRDKQTELPREGAVVRFTRLPQNVEGKLARAIDVEVLG